MLPCKGMSVTVTVATVTPSLDVVNGYGSRQLVEDLRGRAPMWSSNPRGWVIHPSRRADLIALAESRGHVVVIKEAEVIR